MQFADLTEQIIAAAYKIHNTLGSGYLEKVYENAMVVELRQRGVLVLQQHPIPVYYEEVLVGDFIADLLVNETLVIELKAVENLHSQHEVQLVNYLTAMQLDIGLLINFGKRVEVKRKYRIYRRKGTQEDI